MIKAVWNAVRVAFPAMLLCSPPLLIWLAVPAYHGITGLVLVAASAASVLLVVWACGDLRHAYWAMAPFSLPAALLSAYVFLFALTPGEGLWLSIGNINFAEFDSLLTKFVAEVALALLVTLAYVACLVSPMPRVRGKRAATLVVLAALTAAPLVMSAPVDVAPSVRLGSSLWWKTFPFGMAADLVETIRNDMAAGDVRIASPHVSRRSRPGKEVFVLIIGESTRRDTWLSSRAAFPSLNSPNNVFFGDAISQAVYTKHSVPMLISGVTGAGYRGQPNFLHFAKATGCNPVWLTMNDVGMPYKDVAEFYDNWRTPALQKRRYDTDLLPLLAAALSKYEKLCVVLHIDGAHNEYVDRYPASFRPHPVPSAESAVRANKGQRDQQVQAYRYAVAYSQHFLQEVILSLERHEARAFLVFAPDHAENLWDDSRELSLHGFASKIEFEIPLHVWASSSFIRERPVAWAQLQANAALPVSNENVLATLLDAMDVEPLREGSLMRRQVIGERLVHVDSIVMPYKYIQ